MTPPMPYMRWAKLESGSARFNLATSGVMNFPLAELPLDAGDLEINGPGGYGYAPLLERLAQLTGAAVENIVPSLGTSMANFVALSALISRGDEVLVERPTYHPMLQIPDWLGANVKRFARRPENAFRADLDEIRRAVSPNTRLIVLANLHNPSSALIDESEMQLIGQIAASVGALVFVDEVYLETLWDRRWRSAFQLGDNFVVTSSLTKAYGLSGLRCGWIVAPREVVPKLWNVIDMTYGIPAHAAERLSVLALDHLDAIRDRARRLVEQNRLFLNRFLDANRESIASETSTIGTTVVPRLLHREVDEFCETLRREFDTTVVPGSYFETPDCIRIGIGGDTELLREGLARIATALRAPMQSGCAGLNNGA